MVCNKTRSVFLLNKKIHILLSQVYCVWQVVKTRTISSNNPVYCVVFSDNCIQPDDGQKYYWPKHAVDMLFIFNNIVVL